VDWLNYHHLLYFWTVAREGSIAAAANRLHLARPTVSGQLRQLEKSLGDKLFEQVGKRLVLTDFGEFVFRYADEIFTTGSELQEAVRGKLPSRPARLVVGIPDVLPKLIAYRLLRPALELQERVHLICNEGKLDDLLTDLAMHRLDLVLADAPISPTVNVRAYNHPLGECTVTVFGTPDMARKYRRGFPQSLNGAPMLLPAEKTSVRRALDQWFDSADVHPQPIAEFEDSALLKVFGQEGLGLFPAPSAIEKEIRRQYRVTVVGRLDEVLERFYAISVERRLRHPAVIAISDAARDKLFV